jgi:hypothetical protein
MREWLYQQMLLVQPSVFGERVYEGESLTTTPRVKPFMTYNIGNSTDEQLSDEPRGPERQFFQIYIHDEGGDYTQIDDAVLALRQQLEGASDPNSGIVHVYYLETSRDLDDSTMGTILRYVRFQAVRTRSTT